MTDRYMEDQWLEQIDGIVADVFRRMLGQSCAVADKAVAYEGYISARILLSGTFEAQCVIELPQASAKKLTDAFLGGKADWGNDTIEDAVGELCNMIAGGWKSTLETQNLLSDLSVPTISRGPHLSVMEPTGTQLRRNYAFDNSTFTLTLAIL